MEDAVHKNESMHNICIAIGFEESQICVITFIHVLIS